MRKSILALFATLLLVGCGAKSGKSSGQVSGPASHPTTTETGGEEQRPIGQPNSSETSSGSPVIHKRPGTDHSERTQRVEITPEDFYGSDGGSYADEQDYGRRYEYVNDKGQFEERPVESPSSGERFGEFGAVLFDDPMWFPGLPDYPAGHSGSKISRIFTGGVSDNHYKFTDGKSDGLMAFIVEKFNLIGTKNSPLYHEEINLREESENLAKKILDVNLEVDAYSTSSARLEIKFVDGDVANPVTTLFHGKLDAHRRSELAQVNIKGDKDLQFSAEIVCMDQDGGCQNAVIMLAQWKDRKICRMAYLIHRSGDAHITMAEADRLHYSAQLNKQHQAFAEYVSNTAYNSCQVNKRRKDVPNRLTQHFLAYCGDANQKKLPAAKTIGYKTWAAAYGASGFKLELADEAHWTGYDSGRKTQITGPLVQADVKNPIYSTSLSKVGGYASYIKSAHLVNNDGGGNLNILLRFGGVDESEMRISVTSLIRNTIYPGDLRPEEKLPEDPRG